MKAILQRVLSASVTVDKELISSIGHGVLVFAAVAPNDTEKEAASLASKVLKMKLWDHDERKWKLSVTEVNGEVLCVSQFTLLAKTSKGNKPDFHGSASGEHAHRLYHHFLQKVKEGYSDDKVKDGRFQAMMEVSLVNDGPVTLELVSEAKQVEAKKPDKTKSKPVEQRLEQAAVMSGGPANAAGDTRVFEQS